MIKYLAIILFAIICFGGCQSETPEPKAEANKPAKKEPTPKPTPEKGGEILLDGTGVSSTHVCNESTVSVDPEATASTYTLTGDCKKLVVDGVSNKVFVDKVAEIEVKGTSNKVFYGSGLDGGTPKISKKGTSLEVKKKLTEKDIEKMKKDSDKK